MADSVWAMIFPLPIVILISYKARASVKVLEIAADASVVRDIYSEMFKTGMSVAPFVQRF
jgi:AmiR/NasT family two-component response regulator